MLRRIPSAAAAATGLLALSSQSPLAQQEPEHPPPVEAHELTIDRQVEIAQSMADHEAIAQRLEDEAAQFEREAKEHEQLCRYYGQSLRGPSAHATKLVDHCERIATNLKASATDARSMARMHREIAHKLVK